MTSKAKLISLRDLDTYYYEEPKSNRTAERVIEAENSKKSRIISLVAEETELGRFILIEKFRYFAALKKTKSDLRVPCLVYPGTSDKERLLHILKVCIPLEKNTNWLFYNKHVVMLLEDHNMPIDEIAELVNCDMSKIKNYTLDKSIPSHIRERAVEMKARTVVQNISSSTVIPGEMKIILYEKSILNKDHIHRLTSEKLKMIKMLCDKGLPFFLLYDAHELEKLINELLATNFNLEDHMKSLMSSYMKSNSNKFFQLL